jgi:hypothetical protein
MVIEDSFYKYGKWNVLRIGSTLLDTRAVCLIRIFLADRASSAKTIPDRLPTDTQAQNIIRFATMRRRGITGRKKTHRR